MANTTYQPVTTSAAFGNLNIFQSTLICAASFIIENERIVQVEINEGFCRLVNFKRAELSVLHFQSILSNSLFETILAASINTGTPTYTGWHTLNKNGGAELTCEIELHIQGNVYTMICNDLTQTVRAERKYEALFNSNVVAINYWDVHGNMWGVNQAYTEMKGYTEEEVEKIKWTDIVHPEDVQLLHKPGIEKNKQGIPVKPVETRVKHKNGEYIHILTGYAMLEGSQTEGICMTINITPLKKAEAEIQESLRKRDEFLSIASHELKTPLTTMKICLQLIHSLIEEEDYSRIKNYLLKCDRSIDRQVRLVNELLDITRIDTGKMDLHYEWFSVNILIELTKDFILTTGNAATVKFEGDFSCELYADKHRIEQVIYNLISNAMKYSEQKAELCINVKKTEAWIRIAISDKGIGMEPEKLSSIFDRFYRIDQPERQISGLGLGLYISNQIIRMHEGEIKVESVLGKGSTFTIVLPVKRLF